MRTSAPARPAPLIGDFDQDDAETLPSPSEVRSLVVGVHAHAERLDRALVQCVTEFSRSYLQQLVAAGAVRLNDRLVSKPAQRVKFGDRIDIEMRPTQESQAFRGEAIALEVLYEDAHLLVVNKPAGLVVHPAPGNWSGTLLNALIGRDAEAARVPRAGIVHRLDKDTSGLLMVARTRPVMDTLVHAISERTVHRQYLAIAQGHWSGPTERTASEAIGRDARNRLRMAAVDLARHPGRAARTDIVLLQQAQAHCLLRCTLQTGRTHQIRVHLAHMGLPLVGDVLYGGAPGLGMTRQALHAERLAFRHPVSGHALVFRAPLPADIRTALEIAGLQEP
ncbi:MAG: RluA family pseudouridine synthase [Burkholderiaceae bacterium]|jgi:23S rRNA pseudouridine1911/1915/1917 synthase|nr:RluA family pseudouridine synthase [Burkholderiaceae bacterium]MCO5102871.1 RluA family pseudouridine synthase [Burkholderiaceae bacterium]